MTNEPEPEVGHTCAPGADDVRVVFFTCPDDGRTWLRDPDDPTKWHEANPRDQ